MATTTTGPTLATADFLDRARKIQAWDEPRFAELVPDEQQLPEPASAAAAKLIEQGLLTSYQAKHLLNGREAALLLGSYRILEPLGQQDGKPLFLGEHLGLRRRVFLKILPDEKAEDRATRERFLREARSAAALDHPNIARLFDIGQDHNCPFLVLEALDGHDLQHLLHKKKRLPWGEVVAILTQAAKGLAHAHERDIIHRDLRPENLFLTTQGVVKVKNFGLARSIHNESDNVTSVMGVGSVLASVEFQSPEQILNEALDQRTDLYSLGVTAYTLLAGHPPFQGSLMQIMNQQQGPVKHIREVVQDVPEAVDELVAKLMHPKRLQRFQDAGSLVKALQELQGTTGPNTGYRKANAGLAQLARPTTGRVMVVNHARFKPVLHPEAHSGKRLLALWIGLGIGLALALAGLAFLLVRYWLAK